MERRESNLGLFLVYQSFIVHLCYFRVISKHFEEFKETTRVNIKPRLNLFAKTLKSTATYNHLVVDGKHQFLLVHGGL